MSKSRWLLVVAPVAFVVGAVYAQQFPVLDSVANKVVQKYQTSSCEQLWQKKG